MSIDQISHDMAVEHTGAPMRDVVAAVKGGIELAVEEYTRVAGEEREAAIEAAYKRGGRARGRSYRNSRGPWQR